jgi:hypothetical protein
MSPARTQPAVGAARLSSRAPIPMRCAARTLAATMSVLMAGAASAGGDLRVDWSTTDAGGGIATAGDFSLSGTIAQVDADTLQPSSGGSFELTGGFWVIDTTAPDPIFRDDFETP